MSLSSTYASACAPAQRPSLSLDGSGWLCNWFPTMRESSHSSSLLACSLCLFDSSFFLRTDLTIMSTSQRYLRLRLSHFIPFFIHYLRLWLIDEIWAHSQQVLNSFPVFRAQQFRLFSANECDAFVPEASTSFSWNPHSFQYRWQSRDW